MTNTKQTRPTLSDLVAEAWEVYKAAAAQDAEFRSQLGPDAHPWAHEAACEAWAAYMTLRKALRRIEGPDAV